ncbi:MAG: type II toxin-antitoxin system RelE/ParE family toxin [Alteromonadaceae bacterium]|nr:type II toxin-antitoxin system RelE/ParE family toxin [Alteromonadaceae bacterium]
MSKYILSPEAQNSLKNIKEYSIRNFGTDRTKAYLQNFQKRFQQLSENPARGIMRKDLKVGYYSYFVG